VPATGKVALASPRESASRLTRYPALEHMALFGPNLGMTLVSNGGGLVVTPVAIADRFGSPARGRFRRAFRAFAELSGAPPPPPPPRSTAVFVLVVRRFVASTWKISS